MALTAGHGHAQRARCSSSMHDDVTGEWTINGKTWDDVVDSDYKLVVANPELGDVEIWELDEQVGRLVPPGAHPPRRLQDPRPQRAGRRSRTRRVPRTSCTSARARRCGVIMRFDRTSAAAT